MKIYLESVKFIIKVYYFNKYYFKFYYEKIKTYSLENPVSFEEEEKDKKWKNYI